MREEMRERERLRRWREEMERDRLRRRREWMERERERVRLRRRRATANTTAVYLGRMTRVGEHCQALRFPTKALNCCHNGKISLPALADYPPPLKDLLTGSSSEARNFMEHIRKYNSAFSFASFGAQTVQVSGSTIKFKGSLLHVQHTRFLAEDRTASRSTARPTTPPALSTHLTAKTDSMDSSTSLRVTRQLPPG
jgi:hypothetical protein